MSVPGPGCVKTPTFNLRVEIPSRFRKFENQKCLRPLLREDDRENNSAHSRLVHVFTQPGSIASLQRCPDHFRSTPMNGQFPSRSACLKRAATSGSRQRHSITSSARNKYDAGIVSPIALAALRLMTISYLVGSCTGRSCGFAPLRIRSTYDAPLRNRSAVLLP